MRNAWKISRWEIRRNLKNKSFLIGMFLTPVLFLAFIIIGNLFDSDAEETLTQVYVADELQAFELIANTVTAHQLHWDLQTIEATEKDAFDITADSENTALIFLDERALTDGLVPVYTSADISPFFMQQVQLLEQPLKTLQMKQQGFSDEELALLYKPIHFSEISQADSAAEQHSGTEQTDLFERIVPSAFAGIILLSIVFSGMYIFQSASQEKKDKVAEIILSSVTASELMQGKIIGYFILGMIQSFIYLIFVIPIAWWQFEIHVFRYLFVPELLLFLLFAILGYLLFAALFVGIGATMSDIASAGNFQGTIMMLPFLPFLFIAPVINDPNGFAATIGSLIPFSASGVLLLRLSMLEAWPWPEIIISLVILIISVWLCMKLAGKIFQTGILLYGKNATPKEIWKWLRA